MSLKLSLIYQNFKPFLYKVWPYPPKNKQFLVNLKRIVNVNDNECFVITCKYAHCVKKSSTEE